MSRSATAQLQTFKFWVNPETGDDAGPGTSRQPYKTVNHALGVAHVLKHPAPGGTIANPIIIYIWSTATPIAPRHFGGSEDTNLATPNPDGWQAGTNAFPLRMVDGVDLVGIPEANGVKPRITIVESGIGPSLSFPWGATSPRALIYGNDDCVLKNLDVDGTPMKEKSFLYGIVATDCDGFDVEDCLVKDQHDGIRYFASTGEICTGTVSGSMLSHFYPVEDDNSATAPTTEGHAGLWLEGGDFGTVEVTVMDCDFEQSHDGVEVAGPPLEPGTTVSNFSATLTVVSSRFRDNENGIEVVGNGTLEVVVSGCQFVDNFNNRPTETNGDAIVLATPLEDYISCIAIRGMLVRGCVRDCLFQNFGVGVSFGPHPSSQGSCLDLGRSIGMLPCCTGDVPLDSPGGNTFLLPLNPPWDPNVMPVKGAVLNGWNPPVPGRLVTAYKNTWIANNQGADAMGCLLPVPSAVLGPVPSTPAAGQTLPGVPAHYSAGANADRNYAVFSSNTGIDFGEDCP